MADPASPAPLSPAPPTSPTADPDPSPTYRLYSHPPPAPPLASPHDQICWFGMLIYVLFTRLFAPTHAQLWFLHHPFSLIVATLLSAVNATLFAGLAVSALGLVVFLVLYVAMVAVALAATLATAGRSGMLRNMELLERALGFR